MITKNTFQRLPVREMGDDRYKLIDVEVGKLPDVCDYFSLDSSKGHILFCTLDQNVDIQTLIQLIDASNPNCTEALKELALALSEGFSCFLIPAGVSFGIFLTLIFFVAVCGSTSAISATRNSIYYACTTCSFSGCEYYGSETRCGFVYRQRDAKEV